MEEEAGKPPVARLLTAGARGAGRVAHATGVDRALDEAVEEAILRALRSPAVGRAIERAMASHTEAAGLSSEELAQIIKQVLESEAAEQVWGEVLESREVQMLIERIAGAPELRAAIAAQGAGLITDIGVKLTRLTEAFDDALERIVRRRDPDSETDQAGLATRLVAFAIDFALLFAVYSLASGVIASVVSFSFGSHLSLAGSDRARRDRLPPRRSGPGPVLVTRRPDAGDAVPVNPPDQGRDRARCPWAPRSSVCSRSSLPCFRSGSATSGSFATPLATHGTTR